VDKQEALLVVLISRDKKKILKYNEIWKTLQKDHLKYSNRLIMVYFSDIHLNLQDYYKETH